MAYLRLCRLPTVFTALADIMLGFMMSHAVLEPKSEFFWLLGASAGLYLSGMVFNDIFDVRQDTEERPHRPIPSGVVPFRNAMIFAVVLMAAGLFCASQASTNSLIIAGMLTVAILLYDGVLKKSIAGPVAMGSCRFLNVLLGASSGPDQIMFVFQNPQLWVGLSMGIYIIGVTFFARNEANKNARGPLIFATVVINIGLVMLALWLTGVTTQLGIFNVPGGLVKSTPVLFLWGIIMLTINRKLFGAISEPTPGNIQPAIGTMLLAVIMLDAMLIYFKLGEPGIPIAMGTVALLIPAVVMRRWIPMT